MKKIIWRVTSLVTVMVLLVALIDNFTLLNVYAYKPNDPNMNFAAQFMEGWNKLKQDFQMISNKKDNTTTTNSRPTVGDAIYDQRDNMIGTGASALETGTAKFTQKVAGNFTQFSGMKKMGEQWGKYTPFSKALTINDTIQKGKDLMNGGDSGTGHRSIDYLKRFGDTFAIGGNITGKDQISITGSVIADGAGGSYMQKLTKDKTNKPLTYADWGAEFTDGAAQRMMGGGEGEDDDLLAWIRKMFGFGDTKKTPTTRTAIKPNIYLYPESEREITVKFENAGLLKTVIPDYNDNWTVLANTDGELSVDGEKYGFLFYESYTTENYMQKDSGYIVPLEKREEFFKNICDKYEFNEQETTDFVEFWCERLDTNVEYYMYPELTSVIDKEMPMNVYPAADSIFRIWFVFTPIDDSNKSLASSLSAPSIDETIERNGFTVVEWGGIVEE